MSTGDDGDDFPTLRDYFAGQAMAALIEQLPRQSVKTVMRDDLATEAYRVADAMLLVRAGNA